MEENLNLTHNDVHVQLKHIFDGCDTILDALPFCNMYAEKFPHMKSMINSYTNGRIYKDNVDIKTKQSMMNDINLCDTRDNALNMISKISERTNDEVYKKALERIALRKHHRPQTSFNRPYISFGRLYQKTHTGGNINTTNNINKKCPHCSHVLNMPENTNYVICGYHNPNSGYDWNGCGKDWCFHCNKMLCKSWIPDLLNLKMNRVHDDECCSKHANENGFKYPDNYCQCNHINIRRNNNNILTSLMH